MQDSNKKAGTNMTSWMRNQIASLYNFVLAPMTATRDTFQILQSVNETDFLLYNRMI